MNLLRLPFRLSSLLIRALVLVAAGGVPAALPAQSYTFSTLAGTPGVSGDGDNSAQFIFPHGLAADSAGNIYVVEIFIGTVRKITSTGVVTSFAGTPLPTFGTPRNYDGAGSAAQFVTPYAVAVDGGGNVYVANAGNVSSEPDQIRKITSGGVVTTLRTVPARLASLAVDGAGIVYFIFEGGNGIYKLGSIGDPTLLAGGIGAGSAGYADGTGTNARFDRPSSIAVDQAGNVYVTDTNNHAIRKITSTGVVTTVAGQAGTRGNADGTGTAARFNRPTGLAVDSTGSLYVFDGSNYTVRKITSGGVVTTLAGLALASGSINGIGNAARFGLSTLRGLEQTNNNLTVDGAGNVYVAELSTATIRKITSSGVVTTLAGTTGLAVPTNRPTLAPAQFNAPGGAAVDRAGNVYVADSRNRAIRRITSDGAVTTLTAGGIFGLEISDLSLPSGVALDSAGDVYVADRETHRILKISYLTTDYEGVAIVVGGNASPYAGSPTGTTGFTDGVGSVARFNAPSGVAVDDAGNVYVADTNNHTIRKINSGGNLNTVTTLAGLAGSPGASNGTGNAARFSSPFGVAVDKTGNIYVADTFNHTIRKITSGGAVTTLAGLAGSGGIADGTGAAARFNLPSGVAIDSAGNVFVTDSASDTIRKVTSAGVVTTIAGDGSAPAGSVDGVGTAARFNFPFGVAEYEGTLFVVDANNHTLRKGVLGTPPTFTSAAIAAGTVGVSFNYAATYSGTPANTFGASGLPPGLLSNVGSGVISGIPNTAGTFSVHLGGSNSAGTGSGTVVITIAPAAGAAPLITVQPLTQSATVGSNVTFSVSATSTPTLTYQWSKDSVALSGATTSSLVLNAVSVSNAGSYSVVVTNSGGSVTSAAAVLTVTGTSPVAPGISLQPVAQMVTAGGSVTLSVTATGTPTPTYQWRKDGVAIAGATASSLTLSAVYVSSAGSYSVVVTNSAGSTTSAAAVLGVTVAGPTSALSNLSVRTTMASGQILIVGAVVNGGAKTILIRVGGPALSTFGLAGMADPRIELYTTGALPTATNDDWPAALASTFSSLGAFAFSPGSKDAALSQALNGSFTVQAKGTGPGTVIVEAYDVAGGVSPRLVNLSARSLVGTGDDILIAGFNLAGTGTKQVLIRAIGPGLAAFGVPGTLLDPRLQVFSAGGTVVATNDNWAATLAPTFAQVGAFPLPAASGDAALLVTLNAGSSYTVQVSGANGGTGEALIEVYEIF